MKKVAKIVIIDSDDKYLILYRSNHPRFSGDPDLPGGIVEKGESALAALTRELKEEVGMDLLENEARQIYSGVEYSKHGTHYNLFVAKILNKPNLAISWEHSRYEWLSKDDFLITAKNAKDTYMHMVHDIIEKI